MSREIPATALQGKCLAAINRHRMIEAGERIVVALSGGADSVALLHALLLLQRGHTVPFTLAAAHLNHNLRGRESLRDETFVRRLCDAWGLPLTVCSLPIAELAGESGRSVELCAREERYAFFRGLGGKTATAHTLDDSAETVLLNLARGTGLRGLCGIPPVREGVIRPLILCTRAEVEAHCAAHGLDYVNDSTNQSDDYTRNRLRHAVVPVLREIAPGFPQGIAGMTRSLRADDDYLTALAAQALAGVARGQGCWDAVGLSELPEPIRRRAIRELLARHGVPLDRRRIERVEALLRTGGGEQLSAGWLCRCAGGRLALHPVPLPGPTPLRPVELRAPYQDARIPVQGGKMLILRVLARTNFEESINILPNQFKNALDCDKIGGIVTIRPRLPGDRIRLAGRGCTKSLKKLFQESGLSARQRERTLVLAGENGLLWVEGFGAAQSAVAGPGTARMLTLAVEQITASVQDEMKKSEHFLRRRKWLILSLKMGQS